MVKTTGSLTDGCSFRDDEDMSSYGLNYAPLHLEPQNIFLIYFF